jgi:glutamine---fructose-6-phosphate transaminase (isomerizing)
VVHNGIIENFAALRREISARHHLASDTDTEVVAQLIEDEMAGALEPDGAGALPGALATAMRRVGQRLEGAFTLVAVDARDPVRWSAPAATPRW